MEFFRLKKDIPFMSYGRLTTAISLITFLLAIFFLISRGLNLSVEFTGGTVIQLDYAAPVDPAPLRLQLEKMGFKDASVQNYGSSNSVIIRVNNSSHYNSSTISSVVFKDLQSTSPANPPSLKSVQFIGPQVGQELVQQGLLAILFVCLGIVIYLAVRFEWRFAVSAIIANMHDVIIILGFFAFFRWEFSLTVLAAILAVLGYSVNESVVVFDRIRENFRTQRETKVSSIINNAITTTMSRTIITHTCTELMVLSMLFFGGPSLHNFALALTIGILFSIYSSVLVASPVVMWLGISKVNLIKPKKRKEEAVI